MKGDIGGDGGKEALARSNPGKSRMDGSIFSEGEDKCGDLIMEDSDDNEKVSRCFGSGGERSSETESFAVEREFIKDDDIVQSGDCWIEVSHRIE